MKCTKCGSELPADSEFCQYCGTRIFKVSPAPEPVVVQETRNIPATSSSAFEDLMANYAVEAAKMTAANEGMHNQYVGDSNFGLTPDKPIYTRGIKEQEKYLSLLRTPEGKPIKWSRRGSISVDGVNGLIDVYDTSLMSGEHYKTIYINMYGANNSTAVPVGFSKYEKPQRARAPKKLAAPHSGSNKNSNGKTRQMFPVVLSIVLAVILLISVATNIFQHVTYKNSLASAEAEITSLEKTKRTNAGTISTLKANVNSNEATIQRLNNQIELLRMQVDNMQDKVSFYDEIVVGMKSGNAGYAASNFFAHDSVIVVSKSDTSRKFTLTANWSNGGTVKVNYTSDAAWVTFDDDEWYTSTKITVHPRHEGVTVVTFSNSVDTKTFKVLIIVY